VVFGEKSLKKPVASPEQFAKQPPEERLKVREALLNQMDLIDAFVAENPFAFPEGDLDIIRSWKDLVAGKFIVFRYLKKHTIFLTLDFGQVGWQIQEVISHDRW
jgi:hypothetical protein